MIYVLTEWDGKGSGEKTLVTRQKSEAMLERECVLPHQAAIKKYGKNHFRCSDVKASGIDSYYSERAMREGDVRTSKTWY